MTLAARVRTHKLSPSATLCASGFNQLGADSPAIEAMTDFARVPVVTITADAAMSEAQARMISRGVRLLLVTGNDEVVVGLITARDLHGERPMQIVQARGCARDDLLVKDVMTPISRALGVPVLGFELASTFAEIEAALAP